MRERMAQHRTNPACSSCHQLMDPIGLSFEHFDATGRWRIKVKETFRSMPREHYPAARDLRGSPALSERC
ncbi:MAG: hypothetical protein DMG12_26215 [Acidobacteria bacterium]|nr:MAG: hypothetical protein DMG12_26215 [Acidobacteriota bacterium]